MKYRKKPVVIEAFMYGIEPRPNWFIKGVQGEIYPCKADIFEMMNSLINK